MCNANFDWDKNVRPFGSRLGAEVHGRGLRQVPPPHGRGLPGLPALAEVQDLPETGTPHGHQRQRLGHLAGRSPRWRPPQTQRLRARYHLVCVTAVLVVLQEQGVPPLTS